MWNEPCFKNGKYSHISKWQRIGQPHLVGEIGNKHSVSIDVLCCGKSTVRKKNVQTYRCMKCKRIALDYDVDVLYYCETCKKFQTV